MIESLVDQAPGNLQVAIGEGDAAPVAGDPRFKSVPVTEEEETSLGARHRERRVDHGRENILARKRILQRTGHFHHGAKRSHLAALLRSRKPAQRSKRASLAARRQKDELVRDRKSRTRSCPIHAGDAARFFRR